MFKTAIHDHDNTPERLARTSCPATSKRIRIPLKKSIGREQQFVQQSSFRPFTSNLQSPRGYQTLNTTGKSANLVNMRTIDVVENDLQSEYKQQMCGYLRKKLRQIVGKRQQDIIYSRYLNSTVDNPQIDQNNNSSISPLGQLYSTFTQKSRLKKQKGVDEAYISNAKEHVLRMIQRKREEKDDFQDINNAIKIKSKKNNQKRTKSLKDHFKCAAVQKQSWDKNWKQSISQQKTRYRNRLLMKYNRQNKNQWLINFNQ